MDLLREAYGSDSSASAGHHDDDTRINASKPSALPPGAPPAQQRNELSGVSSTSAAEPEPAPDGSPLVRVPVMISPVPRARPWRSQAIIAPAWHVMRQGAVIISVRINGTSPFIGVVACHASSRTARFVPNANRLRRPVG